MSRLSNYKSKQPSSQLLKQGEHAVRLLSVTECTSFDQVKAGKVAGEKDDLPDWSDPTPQIAVVVGNGDGALTHRFNEKGYLKFGDLTEKEVRSGKYTDVKGYACIKDKKGILSRVEDTDKTSICTDMIDHFIWALGFGEDVDGDTAVDTAIAEKKLFTVKVVTEEWEGEEQFRIDRFMQLKAVKELVADDLES